MRRTVLYLFFCLLVFSLQAQPTTISGHAPSYARVSLSFYITRDWIAGTEKILGTCNVSDSGDFKLSLDLPRTEEIMVHLGANLGYFFAEPGKQYQLVLPPYLKEKPEDRLNPYFQPEEVHLGLVNFKPDELNMLITMFNDAYQPYYDKHVHDVYLKPDQQQLDADIASIEKPFHAYPDAYFRDYRHYRYGLLKLFANQQKVQSLSDEYFNDHTVLYNNPAYTDLFNQVYHKYFEFYGRTDQGKKIYPDINEKGSYHALLNTLSANRNFSNDTLKELVILKEIHDEFYGSQFSRKGLLIVLDSLIAETQLPIHREIGLDIRNKITRLLAGYPPPSFALYDTKGNLVHLSDFAGKYIYLNFCTCQSYTCLNEFNALSKLHDELKTKLVILTIATDPLQDVLQKFLIKNHYTWEFLLYDHQPEVLKDYDIRAFPTYFLIGPDGKLILSPAPSPSEDFESKLFEVMKERGDLQ
jgi:peroxiredoxin